MTTLLRALLLVMVLGSAAARAQDALGRAMSDFNEGRNQPAAIGFFQASESAGTDAARVKAESYLAQSLERLGLPFGAFFHYGNVIQAGPSYPEYLKAVERAAAITAESRDEVVGPNVLSKAFGEPFARLPPGVLAEIDASLALLDYRAGKYDEAEQLVSRVPRESAAFAQAQYLLGLLLQRKDPEKALAVFRSIPGLRGAGGGLEELAGLALGRTLYALKRYPEASAAYAALPRFSRHWDEALFEGAYADLRAGDDGAALGKLHSLHSPHLSDEFAPESLNLTAIIYHRHCLYPQARETLDQFDRVYVPIKARLKAVLEANAPVATYWEMLQQGDARLPNPVRLHLRKNERVEAMARYLSLLDLEAQRVRRDQQLASSALGVDLLDLIARQKALMEQVAGKFVQGRLADMAHLIEMLDADKEIIRFETAKGEKEMLETSFDVKGRLEAQRLGVPAMPATGHEYWPFDGEYWPDEIGYYKVTLKDACPAKKDE